MNSQLVSIPVACVLLFSANAFAQAPDGARRVSEGVRDLPPAAGRRFARAESRGARPVRAGVVLTALTTGNMFRQGSDLSDAEQSAVAAFLAGRPVGAAHPLHHRPLHRHAGHSPDGRSNWNGWGGTATNTRYQPARQRADRRLVPRLKLKWAFGFPGVSSAARRSRPWSAAACSSASESGDVFALDAKTGCTYWTFHAQAGIRTARLGRARTRRAAARRGYAVYFADGGANAYARRRRDRQARSGRARSTIIPTPRRPARRRSTTDACTCRSPGVSEEGQGGRRSTSAARSAAASRRSTRTPAPSSGRPTPSPKSRSRAARTRTACRRGDPPAAASGRRRRSTRGAARLRRDRQRLRGSGAADDRRRHRAGHGHRQDPLGEPAGCRTTSGRRAAGRRTPTTRTARRSSGPTHDFSASPMLAKRSNGQRHPDHPAEVGDGLRLRSRQGGRARVAVPHERRQRPRRAVGRRRRRPAGLLRRQRHAGARRPAACAR